jgi:hypothetical protein
MMRKSLAHLVCQGLFVALTASLLAGCQKSDEPAAGPPPPTVVRHDLPDLVKRYPPLGEPASASWVVWGGNVAAGEDPDQINVEYVDAVVVLKPGGADALVTYAKPTDTGRTPLVQEILRSEVPAGPFLTSDALDKAFGSFDASTYVYLDRGRNTLVLQSTGLSG